MTPMIGAWRLVSLAVTDETGATVSYPMGEDPHGLLLYTDSGWMSVHLSTGDRPHFASALPRAGSTAEKVAALDTFFGYGGRYEVTGDRVTHHITISSFPNWVGAHQRRAVEWDGERLALRAPLAEGQQSTLVWQRA